MNKKAQPGTNNRIGLKWLNPLILAIAATLSFHYKPTIEAMEEIKSNLTYDFTYKQIEDLFSKHTLDLAEILENTSSSLTDALTEGQIEAQLNKHMLDLAEKLNVSTTNSGDYRPKEDIQKAITKELAKAEFRIYSTKGLTCDQLIEELIWHEKKLNALLQKRNAEGLKQQISELQKSYQRLIEYLDSSLSSSERVYPYQESKEWRIYIEEHDQDPQLTKEQIEDRFHKHMLDLAEILNVSTTNSDCFREEEDIQKDITKELTKEEVKTYQTPGLLYDQLIPALIWHEEKLNALLQKRNAEGLKQQISELQKSYQHMRRNLELALSSSEQV